MTVIGLSIFSRKEQDKNLRDTIIFNCVSRTSVSLAEVYSSSLPAW